MQGGKGVAGGVACGPEAQVCVTDMLLETGVYSLLEIVSVILR